LTAANPTGNLAIIRRPKPPTFGHGVPAMVPSQGIITTPADDGTVPWGHKDVSTTMIYTHVLSKGGRGVSSPLDGP
jgi:hypothetical protein